MQTISMDKKYKTRDGREVRILCTDAEGEYPVVALISSSPIMTYRFTVTGSFRQSGETHPLDLIDVDPYAELKAAGKTIQFKSPVTDIWEDISAPYFNAPPERYRIKPEPNVIKYLAYENSSGFVYWVREGSTSASLMGKDASHTRVPELDKEVIKEN